MVAIALRKDFGAAELRRLARGSKDSGQARRLLALAGIYDGGSRSDAARVGETRHSPPRAARPAHAMGLHLRGHLSGEGEAIGLILPWCDTNAMNAHLAEISAAVEPGAHAVLIMDQAGWHTTSKLNLPDNITILPLPPRAPELNFTENLWQFMHDNWLSNRVFEFYDQIVALCCEAWNRLESGHLS